ncbi:hypothetical protein ACIOD2_26175 [Amycolatopsis sp. NPDC088138]|uniref:hypothetical protein n=1 Tax=Amycolatopsis sp. NPDC088138 TaxID=3363938 RepID=UPI003811D9D1
MRLVRLERQQSRVADDVRAALASLGRGSTVVGGIALIGVGTVTDRPIEAVVLLPHGVIIVIGVDLPDPALRLEAPLGAEWRADGWPLVADDDAVNPATEALDLSQACESRIVELVPGTAPVGTIVAVGPYVETVDQPASDLAGPVRVLHPTPTTMLAAAVSLATAHRPRSVDQVRALIRGLAPDAPEFSDEVLLGEGFSRFSDDTPPESLWDTVQRVPSQVSGTPARGLADWRTETPSASSRTQTTEALGIPKGPDSEIPADSATAETSETILDTAVATDTANSADFPPAHPEAAAAVAPDTASDSKKPTKSAPAPTSAAGEPGHPAEPASAAASDTVAAPGATTPAATPETTEPELPAESAAAAAPNAAAALGSTQPAELGPLRTPAASPETTEPSLPAEAAAAAAPNAAATLGTAQLAPPRTPAASPETTESAEDTGPAEAIPAAANTTAALGTTTPAGPTSPRTLADSAPAVAPDTTATLGTTNPTEHAASRTPAESVPAATPDTTAALGTTNATEPAPPRTPAESAPAVTPNTTAAPGTTSLAEPAAPRIPAETAPATAADTTATPGTTNPTEPAPRTPAEPAAAVAPNTAAVLRAAKPADSGPARTSAAGLAAALDSTSITTKSAESGLPDFVDSERTETLGKPASVLPLFPGAEQIPPHPSATDTERTETLPHPGPPRPAAAPLPRQETPAFPPPRANPRPAPAAAAPTSRTVRWLPLGAIGLLVALVVAAVVVATSGDDTTAAPASQAPVSQPPSPQPTKAAPAESLQFSLRAADGDQRCASHAFGDAQASLQQTSCSGVRRASYTTTVDGRAGAVTIGIVAFPDAAQAAAFKAITDTPGGGGILDLAAETGKWDSPAPKFENAAYTSKLEGTSVRVVQAVWVPGPSTPDDPGLARAAKAALDLPAQ